MTNESSSSAEHYVTCGDCDEQNKLGSVRCARCGADLPKVKSAAIDPELRDFNAAQAELAEKIQRERRKTVMIDILRSSGSAFKPH
jgi:transcription initiation factor IIE alpha subunit